MRKIECACGISHQIYDWPPSEVEQNNKKMMERHITCNCKREIVVRTAPKYEPEAELEEGEKIATVSSFAELSRQFGVLKEAPAHNKPAPEAEEPEPGEKSVRLAPPEKKLFLDLVMNYAKWFKQGKASAKEQEKFFKFHEKVEAAADGTFSVSEEETRMSRMALSERNLYHIYGEELSPADQQNVEDLKFSLKEIL